MRSNLGYPLLAELVLRRKVDAGAWENVQKVAYTYYDYDEDFGSGEDLKTVTTSEWDGSAWQETGTSYYRYYPEYDSPSSSSSSSSSGPTTWSPQAHLLKYALDAAAFERLKNDPSVTDPLTASDTILAQYADFYFEYDDSRRCTREIVQGGSQTFTFEYFESTNPDGYNSWKTKTIETLPDGSRNIVFCNYAGQVMLHVFEAGEEDPTWSTLSLDEWSGLTLDQWSELEVAPAQWLTFRKYDDEGHQILEAQPSAVLGYDESAADLLDYDSGTGKYAYLRDDAGLITLWTIDSCSGYMASESIQEGQLGTVIKLREFEYTACPADSGSSSSSSSSGCAGIVWFVAQETHYPSATDPNETIITSYAYTFYADTCQVEQQTTTLPAIPVEQNGTGVSATTKSYFNEYGMRTWSMDARGFIFGMKYDIPTGAMTQRINDVDTSVETDAPSGWSTPAGGGLNLITDYEHDDRGRITQSLGPAHSIDLSGTATTVRRAQWMVYEENASENVIRVGQGYATGTAPSYTYTLINPVSITVTDKNGKLQEQISATRASTSGKLLPSDTFAQSTYVRWKTLQYTDCCHVASERTYYDIPSSGAGTEGTNYNQTDYGYDVMKRRNRIVTPGGTITRLVFDARGLISSNWVGTNDDGATANDPTGGGADPDNNMVVITASVYDDGQAGGDGNLTRQTQYVDATDTRVTSFSYDFRDRQIIVDGEIDFYQKTDYDNLNRPVKTERYDTDSAGNLIARHETKWNDRGQVFRSIRWGVDPATGTVGNSLTDNTWYDAALNVIESQPAGLMDGIEYEYDSLGRLVKETNPLNAETDYAYDAASNRISLTDAEDNTTTWGYDGIGRVVKETNDLNDSRAFEYDDAGMLSVRTDRNGRVIEFDYDDAGDLTEERWKTGGVIVNTLQFTYDADSRIATSGDDFSSYAYQYGLNGGLTEVDNNGTSGVPRVILSAQYNRQVEQTSLSAQVAGTNDFLNDWLYDLLGRTTRLDQQGNGGNSVADKRIDFAYEVRGGYSTIDRFADLSGTNLVAQTSYSYDDFARVTDIDHTKGATSLASHAYQYNANRLIDQHVTVDGDSDYSYDDAAQLTSALHSFEADESYSYDLTGNRTNTGYSTGDDNQLLTDGTYNYQYDAEGNRTRRTSISSGDFVEYDWDHRNRLTKVTFKDSLGIKTKEIENVYDVDNRRIAKLLDSNGDGNIDDQWHFVYDQTIRRNLANAVLVYDASGNLRNRFLHGPNVDQVLAKEDGSGNVIWPLTDFLGTVRDLADYDSGTDTTSIVNHLTYNAFGKITSQTNAAKTPFYSFTGRVWDPDAELFFYRARWYDALAGRFLTEDPIGFDSGDPNLYRYVMNCPVMLTDPSGHKVEICCRATRIPIFGTLGFPHCWIRTGTEEVGRGPVKGKCCNSCICAQTQQSDHSGEVPKYCMTPEGYVNWRLPFANTGLELIPGSCNEKCVNDYLTPGAEVGRFAPVFSDCHAFVLHVLGKCCKFEKTNITPPSGKF